MPVCRDCGLTAASVEMRRLPNSGGAVCKDKFSCKVRKADRRLMADIQKAS